MTPENKNRLYSAIGAVAFVIGGLLARANALEGLEKLEKTFKKHEDPLTPPPPATEPNEPSN